jgi:hypothetical protein
MFGALFVILPWLVGCATSPEPAVVLDTAPLAVEEPGLVQWSLQPSSLALGETPVDQPVAGVLTLTNTGDEHLQLVDLIGATEDRLEVSMAQVCLLSPGAECALDVMWTPQQPGALDAALSFAVGVSADQAEAVTVPVQGTALGGIATISTSSYDFGDVGIGCELDLLVTLTNTGNSNLQVDAVGLDGAEGFHIYTPTDLPWVLAPFESREWRAFFEPVGIGGVSGEMWFDTDGGVVATELQGNGSVDEERTLVFDIGEQSASTIIFDVNYTAIPDSNEDRFSEFLVDSLPTFFQTLLDHDARFRAAFVWDISGSVDGPLDYLDESLSAAEAADAAMTMLESGKRGGDNDANFATLAAAIDANGDWLFEDEEWSDSRLNLVTIQNDMEQSGGHWSSWVSDARGYKDNDEDLVFHAIAGPVPSGCSGAEAFRDYDQAVTATGGSFVSICASDWTSTMATIATACLDGPQGTYLLESTPVEYSIEVAVDGVAVTEGWSYDADMKAVVMDDDARPEFGSSVTIDYWTSGDCG